jgi:hypothetical protein
MMAMVCLRQIVERSNHDPHSWGNGFPVNEIPQKVPSFDDWTTLRYDLDLE